MSTSPSSTSPRIEPGSDRDMRRQVRNAALWCLLLVGMLALAARYLGVREMADHLRDLEPPLILAVLGLSLANYLLRSLRWQLLSRHAGIVLPLARNSLYYVSGFAFTVTPGKLGEVFRLWLLRRYHGYRYERTAGLLVMDRLTDALPLVLVALLGSGGFAGQAWTLAAMTALMLATAALVLRPGWLIFLVKRLYGLVGRAPQLFVRLIRMLRQLRVWGGADILTPALLLGLAGWLAESAGCWLVLQALGADLGFADAAFVFAFGMLVGALPLFPGGVGGAEGTMIATLVLQGVSPEVAVTATAVTRLATLGFAVGLGFLALPFTMSLRPGGPAAVRAAG